MKAKQARKNQRKREKASEKRISCGGIGPAEHGQCKCKCPWNDDLVEITGRIVENPVEVIRCKR